MLKNFLMRKMLEAQLKQVPQEQREQILTIVERNPELFIKIAQEVQEKMKTGKNQEAAALEVMGKYKEELANVLKN